MKPEASRKKFGANLRKLRLALPPVKDKLGRTWPVSQRLLSKTLKLSFRAYHSWEVGEHEPRIETIAKLAKFYGVTMEDLRA